MRRREFLAGVSSVSVTKPPDPGSIPSVQEAIRILESAVRREIAGVQEIRVSFEPDERRNIALLFAVVRKTLKQIDSH